MAIDTLTTIEISKEDLKFSAAHFTIFSATERERLHGHNFKVSLDITAEVGPNGLCFSYVEIKQRLRALVAEYDEFMILPADSPYLSIEQKDGFYSVRFNDESLSFPLADTLVLPIRNTTVEEFARLLLERLLEDAEFIDGNGVRKLVMKVSSGPGQSGSASWKQD